MRPVIKCYYHSRNEPFPGVVSVQFKVRVFFRNFLLVAWRCVSVLRAVAMREAVPRPTAAADGEVRVTLAVPEVFEDTRPEDEPGIQPEEEEDDGDDEPKLRLMDPELVDPEKEKWPWRDGVPGIHRIKGHELEKAMMPAKAFLTVGEKLITMLVAIIKWLTERWFTHVLLVLLLLGYAALGAFMFRYVEAPHEERALMDMQHLRSSLAAILWNESRFHEDPEAWEASFELIMFEYEEKLASYFTQGIEPNRTIWTFIGAMFYSGTIFTTIGYGHIVPNTDTGRALTMVYAAVGIPLLLMVLADLGKVFTRTIKFLWAFVRRFFYTGSCRAVRKAAPVKAVGKVIHQFSRKKEGDLEGEDGEEEPPAFTVDENFDLPVSIALVLLLLYILAGGLLFIQWEDEWSYFQAVYFVFVSLSTIGFGDFVPRHPAFMMATFVYLLFGLALTSMCINVVQESLSHTFKKATEKLSSHMGFYVEGAGEEVARPVAVELASVHKNKSE